jgi:DNA-binding NarL/FixJ family response regulator
MIKVFIVDDHQMITEGIRSLLAAEEDIEWAGSTKTLTALLEALKKSQPDVLLWI